MGMRCSDEKGGFSLVEVCLAVLVVGLGLLSVFALFPTGLVASEAAAADTETGLFAGQVLAGLQARSTEMTWTEWMACNTASINLPDVKIKEAALNPESTIAYYIDVASSTSRVDKVREVTLYALPWRAGTVPSVATLTAANNANVNKFYTELFYTELP